MTKDNIKIVDRWKFSDFQKDREYIYFQFAGKSFKRKYYYMERYPYNYIFTFKNVRYRIQF